MISGFYGDSFTGTCVSEGSRSLMGGSTVVMRVPSGRSAQQMAGVPRCTVLVGNYYIAFSIYYGGKWGPLSHCCFNGPTSRNVGGIYWLSDVYC